MHTAAGTRGHSQTCNALCTCSASCCLLAAHLLASCPLALSTATHNTYRVTSGGAQNGRLRGVQEAAGGKRVELGKTAGRDEGPLVAAGEATDVGRRMEDGQPTNRGAGSREEASCGTRAERGGERKGKVAGQPEAGSSCRERNSRLARQPAGAVASGMQGAGPTGLEGGWATVHEARGRWLDTQGKARRAGRQTFTACCLLLTRRPGLVR